MATESEYMQRDALGYVKVTVAAESSVEARRFPLGLGRQKIADPPLQHRRFLLLRNDGGPENGGTEEIYVGGADVDENNGYPLLGTNSGAPYKALRVMLNVSDGLTVYGIKLVTAEEFRTLELA